MEPTVNIHSTINRYNEACRHFAVAMASVAAGNLTGYEVAIRAAASEAVGSVEWGCRVYLDGPAGSALKGDDRNRLPNLRFQKLLDLLGAATPEVSQVDRLRLQQHRTIRNAGEHHAAIPANTQVLAALRDARKFLTRHLQVAEELLSFPGGDSSARTSEAATSPSRQDLHHRHEGASAWTTHVIAQGLTRLREGRTAAYDATIESLALEAQGVLLRDALGLLEQGLGPNHVLSAMEPALADEIQLELQNPSALDTERLRRLFGLVTRRSSLCVEAGWLKVEANETVAFAEPTLAAVLVGRHIAQLPEIERLALRQRVGSTAGWHEAAWAAVSCGDSIEAWAALLLAANPGVGLANAVVAACAAFGGVSGATPTSDDVANAFRRCVTTLAWLVPRRRDAFDRPVEPDSPWFFAAEQWCGCVLDLARADAHLATDSRHTLDADALTRPEGALARLVETLGLELRLSGDQTRAVLALCAPRRAIASGAFHVVEALSAPIAVGGVNLRLSFLVEWMRDFGAPAMRKADPLGAARSLAIPDAGHAAGFLLNRPELIDEWLGAWKLLRDRGPREHLVEAWLAAIPFVTSRDDAATRRAITATYKMLETMHLGEALRDKLRIRLAAGTMLPHDDAADGSVGGDVLALAGYNPAAWSRAIEGWRNQPSLPWRTLLDAGAPHAAIAGWCLYKLKAREDAHPSYRDGPVGVFSVGGGEVVATGDWQAAFRQAREALDWLLDHGDEAAILALADAVWPMDTAVPPFDLVMGKIQHYNLDRPLSQVLWGRVIDRPAGRSAVFRFVESGRGLAGLHALPGDPIGGSETELWLAVAQILANEAGGAFEGDQDDGRDGRTGASLALATEASQLLACVLRRCAADPSLRRVNGHRLPEEILVYTAFAGADVGGELVGRLRDLGAHEPVDATAARLLGDALSFLALRNPERAQAAVLEAIAAPTLRAMCGDNTVRFWRALVHNHGAARVLEAVDQATLADVGLGLVQALLDLDPTALAAREGDASFLRALVLGSAKGLRTPSAAFWRRAWEQGDRLVEDAGLLHVPAGPWLTELLSSSSDWPAEERIKPLRALATGSSDPTVRQSCLEALIAGRTNDVH